MENREIETLKGINPSNIYIAVKWPKTQELMIIDGFHDNSYLINDDKGLDDFGPSSYMVKLNWLSENNLL